MAPNILLLHGALGAKSQFEKLTKLLSSLFTVHVMDFEGHGKRESNKNFSIDLFSRNVHDFLIERGIRRTHIFGYSMGGYVALDFAMKHAPRVDKIMTLGTKFNWTEESAEKETKMLDPEKIEEKVPGFAKMLAHTNSNNRWKQVVSNTAEMMRSMGAGEKFSNSDLENLQHDVLIGIGTKDKMVSADESKESASLIPNGNLKLFLDVKHPIEKMNLNILKDSLVELLIPSSS